MNVHTGPAYGRGAALQYSGNRPGCRVSRVGKNALDDYVALTASTATLGKKSSGTEKLDGRIIWHPALNGHKGILLASFESVVRPGAYLRATRDGPL
ncbi:MULTISPECIES: hypothetical protein [unclassified Devosia]|uniref:hypothetical protein n=1 Tax=unclassified Devosia TaxID=196773 RepID=UPI0025B8C309|nr:MULTISPECIES: hypothetical protein [unclassified Devosia]